MLDSRPSILGMVIYENVQENKATTALETTVRDATGESEKDE